MCLYMWRKCTIDGDADDDDVTSSVRPKSDVNVNGICPSYEMLSSWSLLSLLSLCAHASKWGISVCEVAHMWRGVSVEVSAARRCAALRPRPPRRVAEQTHTHDTHTHTHTHTPHETDNCGETGTHTRMRYVHSMSDHIGSERHTATHLIFLMHVAVGRQQRECLCE